MSVPESEIRKMQGRGREGSDCISHSFCRVQARLYPIRINPDFGNRHACSLRGGEGLDLQYLQSLVRPSHSMLSSWVTATLLLTSASRFIASVAV